MFRKFLFLLVLLTSFGAQAQYDKTYGYGSRYNYTTPRSNTYSYGYQIPRSTYTTPRYGCAENGSCYGDISSSTSRPKTTIDVTVLTSEDTTAANHAS